MTKLTTRKVNTELRKAGYKLALCQGSGYLYFYVPDEFGSEWLESDNNTDTYSVYTCWLNQLTLAEWMEHAKDANSEIWGA